MGTDKPISSLLWGPTGDDTSKWSAALKMERSGWIPETFKR